MNVEISPKNLDFPAKHKEAAMTDVEVAASLLDQIIGARGLREPVKAMLERAYQELSKRNPAWTRRRVRAVFNKEASRIEHREIEDMRAIIKAREEHAAYREETARLVAMLVAQEAAQDSCMAAPSRGQSSRMDMPGNTGRGT